MSQTPTPPPEAPPEIPPEPPREITREIAPVTPPETPPDVAPISLFDHLVLALGLAVLAVLVLRGFLRPRALAQAPPRATGLQGWDFLVGIALMFVGATLAQGILVSLGLQAQAGEAGTPAPSLTLTSRQIAWKTLIAQTLGQGLPVVYLLVRLGMVPHGLREAGVLPRTPLRDMRRGLLGLLAGVPLVMATLTATILAGWALGLGRPPQVGHTLLQALQDAPDWSIRVLLMLSAVVLAPVLEEAIFRGLVHGSFRAILGPRHAWVVVLLGALLFALVHAGGQPWQTLPGLFVLGLVLGWCYERYASLLVCVVIHAGFNAFNILLLLTVVEG